MSTTGSAGYGYWQPASEGGLHLRPGGGIDGGGGISNDGIIGPLAFRVYRAGGTGTAIEHIHSHYSSIGYELN